MAVTQSTMRVAEALLADGADPLRHDIARLSLMHGWVPATVQAITVVVLGAAVGWRSQRWRERWLPVTTILGVALAIWARRYIGEMGIAGDPAPRVLWIWVALTGPAVGTLMSAGARVRWWRRGVSMLLTVPLCLLSAGLVLNSWGGYFPTVHTAWNQLTAGPLPNQTDRITVTAMQLAGVRPVHGVTVPVTISADASDFPHRRELVYLPPAWFASFPPPRLPVVMMIGSALNTPADWVRAGNAVTAVDSFAATHGGNAPVLVFVDATGAFDNDTECVNGPRGNSADHLTKDVVPYMILDFGVSADRANWGIVGWSMGGTCAIDLTVAHPDLFTALVDIAGDLGPNSGTRAQTIDRLFGGNPAALADFDPTAIMTKHGPYHGVSAWFDVPIRLHNPDGMGPAGPTGAPRSSGIDPSNPEGQDIAADSLCATSRANGIRCVVAAQSGEHDWPFAAQAFAAALPWLAGHLHTPGVPRIPLPGLQAAPDVPTAVDPQPVTDSGGK